MDSIESQIIFILKEFFKIKSIEVVNESHMHNVPKNSETHFKLILVRVIVYYQYEWQDKKICTSAKNIN